MQLSTARARWVHLICALVTAYSRCTFTPQERNGPLRGKGVWKMPTGLVSHKT